MRTRVTELVGVDHPIVQAPMAGPTTPALVSAVCDSGALGSLGAAALAPDRIAEVVAAIRVRTTRPFAVNLFVLAEVDRPGEAELAPVLAALAPIRDELGLGPAVVPERLGEPFEDQLAAVVTARPAVASFTLGILAPSQVDALHDAGIVVIGTATTPAEAGAWAEVGADAVVAQGAEAGGHRATFLDVVPRSLVGTMALVPQVVEAVALPVIAAGGIMDGGGVAAALALGAGAAQLGTAFLGCPEASVAEPWLERLFAAGPGETRLTKAITGRHARGLVNELMERLSSIEADVPSYRVMNALTAEIRAASARAGRADFMALWAGEGVARIRELPAAVLVSRLVAEAAAARVRLR